MIGPAPDDTPPPFLTLGPGDASSPIVVSVPHAGRYYPAEVEKTRAVSWATLRDLEDRYADRLVGEAVADGAAAIVATHARAWIDLNRADDDRETAPSSPHGRAGLGLVPLRLGGRPLWRNAPPQEEVDTRVAAIHRPYHAAVGQALDAARARHGFAVLIDCHSMPSLPGDKAAQLVIGDRHGSSAAPQISDLLLDAVTSSGLIVSRNRPYSGAYVLARHGDPVGGVHAVQLEFDRALYLDPALREPGPGMPRIAALFAELCRIAAQRFTPESLRLAAE